MRSIGGGLRRAPLRALVALLVTGTLPAFAGTPDYANLPANWTASADESALGLTGAAPVSTSSTEIVANKSYVIPALEIVGFDALLNLHNRNYVSDDYASNWSSIRRNLRSGWNVDRDPFTTNQLGHPYQGSMYFGFARSAGLGFWESFGYTFAGSALWEIAGERTPPSKNDQINTGIGGVFLGETLFRMASLVLEHDNVPPFWRELGAAVISPSLGFNRLAFGDRFDAIFPSHDPAYYSRLNLGYSHSTQNEAGTSATQIRSNEALADYSLDYGLPGKPGYTYTRPFDYFTFQGTASSANAFENLMIRGLLVGKDYELGPDYRGVFGVYGTYDYIAPQTYRVSSTGFSVGTTGQWWGSESIAVQGTALIGGGYAAVGSTHSTSDIDYNYGIAPEALVSLRFIYANRVSLDVTGREYFVSHVAAGARGGHDNIVRLDAGLTYRIYGRHGITVKYLGNRRDSSYPGIGDALQMRSTIGVFYTFLGHDGLGAVDWR
jgi:hypothetical protein